MKYRDLIFDLYGTLVDIHTDSTLPEVWEKLAIFYGFYGAHYTGEELRKTFREITAELNVHAGQAYECFPELQFEEIFKALFEKKGIYEDRDELALHAAQVFRILSMEYLKLYPGVKEALKALKKDGHRLWLLTNAQRAFTAYELRALDLEACFDGIYISSDYGCRKPDRRFFEALIDGRGLKTTECLMIGNDMTNDIKGAANMGIDTMYIHSNLSPRADEKGTQNYWMEGADWNEILKELQKICKSE
ncbi:MAG: HAD family hydrolase [Lachnospiraceae bacterium]|nr:HAD family hydrolase [Lachnospiraceae bacterium]